MMEVRLFFRIRECSANGSFSVWVHTCRRKKRQPPAQPSSASDRAFSISHGHWRCRALWVISTLGVLKHWLLVCFTSRLLEWFHRGLHRLRRINNYFLAGTSQTNLWFIFESFLCAVYLQSSCEVLGWYLRQFFSCLCQSYQITLICLPGKNAVCNSNQKIERLKSQWNYGNHKWRDNVNLGSYKSRNALGNSRKQKGIWAVIHLIKKTKSE